MDTEETCTKEMPTAVYPTGEVTFVSRSDWEARPSRSIDIMGTPVSVVFIHHTAMKECSTLEDGMREVKIIQDFHIDDRGWDDIGYNFLVDQKGRVYEGRGWDRIGAHTYRWNQVAVAFSVLGNYTDYAPDEAAVDAINRMIQCGIDNGKLTNEYKVYGHRDVRDTECPGNKLYDLIRTWDTFGPLPPGKPDPTPIDNNTKNMID